MVLRTCLGLSQAQHQHQHHHQQQQQQQRRRFSTDPDHPEFDNSDDGEQIAAPGAENRLGQEEFDMENENQFAPSRTSAPTSPTKTKRRKRSGVSFLKRRGSPTSASSSSFRPAAQSPSSASEKAQIESMNPMYQRHLKKLAEQNQDQIINDDPEAELDHEQMTIRLKNR